MDLFFFISFYSDHSCHPFGNNGREHGIYVSKVVAGGAASQTKLRIGDRILEVNGLDMTNATHTEAVHALTSSVSSSPNEVTLKIHHEPLPPGWKVCCPFLILTIIH